MALAIDEYPVGKVFLASDYNKDEKLDLKDVTLILRDALGILI